jgi:hypothetical protein
VASREAGDMVRESVMNTFYEIVPALLPAWFIAALALFSAFQGLVISFYLMRHHDHLVLHAADVGMLHVFPILIGFHYVLIFIQVDTLRGIAISRLALALFLATDIVIMARYSYSISRRRLMVLDCP